MEVLHSRCAGIDISKRDAKVCVRIGGNENQKSDSKVTTFGSVTSQILALREYLIVSMTWQSPIIYEMLFMWLIGIVTVCFLQCYYALIVWCGELGDH